MLCVVAGVVRAAPRSGTGDVHVSLFPACAAHRGSGSGTGLGSTGAPCRTPLGELRTRPRGWWAVTVPALVTQTREFVALHKAPAFKMVDAMLRPAALAEQAATSLTPEAVQVRLQYPGMQFNPVTGVT